MVESEDSDQEKPSDRDIARDAGDAAPRGLGCRR
jgi:hypothetical protein